MTDAKLEAKQLDSDRIQPEQFEPSNEIQEDPIPAPTAIAKVAAHDFNDEIGDKQAIQAPTRAKIQLSWKNVVITAPAKQGRCGKKLPDEKPKEILRGCSGSVAPGQFLAIIGASGAGKTTLLNYLSGRQISKKLQKTGEILVNGVDRDQISGFASFTGYVQQDDILFQTMTVRECLEFAAKLKLKGTYENKMQRVQQLISDLGIEKCQNTKIGGPLIKGVSGGERKRCSIGVELITDPMLLFLDEPTTGLDSFTATSVCDLLKRLAMSGRTIITTIHQPNSDIFENFDRLMLLAQGKVIYFNEASKTVDYFGSIGYQCPQLSNPADYFMAIMSKESLEPDDGEITAEVRANIESEYKELITKFDQSYQNSALKNDEDFVSPDVKALTEADMAGSMASWVYQYGLLAKRNFLNVVRLPNTSYVKVIVTVITAILCIVLFYNSKYNNAGIQNRRGALFFVCMVMAFNAIQNVILIFPDERPIFLREVNNNMYSVSSYFFAKISSELPASIITPCLFGIIVYYPIGFSTFKPDQVAIFLGVLTLIYNAATGYSLIISALIADKQLAVTLTPVLIIPFMLFAGFFVNQNNIPIYLIEFQYLSIFKYGYQALMLNEFHYFKEDDNYKTCYKSTDPTIHCPDPLVAFDSPEDLSLSSLILLILFVGFYVISLIIMKALSSSFE